MVDVVLSHLVVTVALPLVFPYTHILGIQFYIRLNDATRHAFHHVDMHTAVIRNLRYSNRSVDIK